MVNVKRKLAVLFDLEDTLVRTQWQDRQHVLDFRRETKRKLIELGIPPSILEKVERATIMRNIASEYVAENFSEAKSQEFRQEMETFLRQYEMDSAKNAKLFPDTLSTLETIKRLDIKIGLVTNTSREAVDTVFRHHGLKKYFDVVVTRENADKLKPDPQGVLLAAEKLGAKSFFMVGDLIHDALAAKSAKGTSIIVKRNTETKFDFHADYFVQSLSEVPEIIKTTMEKGRILNVQSGKG